MFRLRAEERRLSFAVERAGDVPRFVHGDEAKLRQVFINLIGNAVKFTEHGSVLARVRVSETSAENVRLGAEITDTGPGIAPDELPRLFQQFEQTASGQRTGGGTGLGLAISREFIRLMGGEIQVVSALGRGTTFHFDFRLGLRDSSAVKPRVDERRVVRIRGGMEPVRVLIADDKPENGELLQQLLRPVGFETRVVGDGEAAVAAFAAWHPRVILMDLRMPGLGGPEAMRRIRRMPESRSVAIIAVTASAFEEDRQQVFDAGGDDFLSKPLRESLLFAKLEHFAGVEYEYADEAPGETPERCRQKVTAAEVATVLPAGTREALRVATLSADFDGLLAMIADFATDAPELAAEFRRLVESFDYQCLLELLEPEGAPV
jgi:CheY-like chemotaxis protein